MGDIKNFDAFWRAKKKDTIKFRAFGVDFEIPVAVSTALNLLVMRWAQRDSSEKLSEEEVREFYGAVFGEEKFDAIVKSGATDEQIKDVTTWISEERKKRAAPRGTVGNRKSRRLSTFSKSGRQSKRTSGASTK